MKTFQFVNIPYGSTSAIEPTPWEIWRHNGIDAEDAATIAGENPWETKDELLARKSQTQPTRKPATPAMVRGKLLRPQALNAYRSISGIAGLKPESIQNLKHPWMIAHPDLMRGFHMAEVHSGEASLRKATETGRLPKPYWAEAQHTMMVAGYRKMEVYLHNATPETAPKTFEVFAAPNFQKDLLIAELKFLNELDVAKQEREHLEELNRRAVALEATIKAIQGKGPRVPVQLFRELIPTYADRRGNPTSAGKQLLELTAHS